jgi:hypothetical protein
MIFSLIQDFAAALDAMPSSHPRRRILRLLDEAIRRDMHFIDRHPTTLFQCLWNSCWWYDCPEAAQHYDLSKQTSKEPLPWEQPGDRLAELLHPWRQVKEQAVHGFTWLRALHPPAVQLGTAQKTVLRGHESGVTGVAISSDGQQRDKQKDGARVGYDDRRMCEDQRRCNRYAGT